MCDTFISTPTSTIDGSMIFGKNSDREPNEAQILEYHSANQHTAGEPLNCTYTSIPQVEQTLAVLLSRPFWMWGAEMGVNEKGVVIGNEAVFTKMPYQKEGGLTGMDMLRLALERASTAESALETIIQLLSDYGQGGICGYQDKKLTYHNSYIICDRNEAWVLETAGHLWAALKVKDHYSISNCLTIGEEFDRAHPDLIMEARHKGWLKKGQTFHFADGYSDWLYTTFSGSRSRKACSFGLIEAQRQQLDVRKAQQILRSHGDKQGSLDGSLIATALCVHAGNGLTRNSQTTGSMVAHLTDDIPELWATATAAPCTSIFKPIWFQGSVLPDLGPEPTGTYDPSTTWWQHEKLHREIMKDASRLELYREERDKLEQAFSSQASQCKGDARYILTESSFKQSREAVQKWIDLVCDKPIQHRNRFIFRKYWEKQNRNAGVPA